MSKGCVVKKLTLAIALVAGLAGGARAAPLAFAGAAQIVPPPSSNTVLLANANLAALPYTTIFTPSERMVALPEPEVFLMMLLGLCLIGYRASRHSDEKFE